MRRLHPRDGPRERPQHAEVHPPPRCADCVAPALSAANLLSAAGLGDIEPPGVIGMDRSDGRARRRIAAGKLRTPKAAVSFNGGLGVLTFGALHDDPSGVMYPGL